MSYRVGGNRLSRGLTLEGLDVSYFLRTASMCDTLLQMARLVRFRPGYDDLIRIWTTDGIARWFSELALVEQSMRDSIVALERAGTKARPDGYKAARTQRSSADSPQQICNGIDPADSWSGNTADEFMLPLSDPAKLQANRADGWPHL